MRSFPASLTGWGFLLLALMVAAWPGPADAAATCALASWYGTESGTRTANGEPFDGRSLTAAHRTLPFGTRLRVSWHGKTVEVRINDRGPARWTGRDLDLSRAAAARLGMIHAGVGRVCWTIIN